MKKLRESVIAKIVAWVLCIASALGIAVLGICIAAGIWEGLFGKTRKEALKSVYEGVNAVYSSRAFDELGNRLWAEEMRENYFKYGIIKSDALSGIDLHDRLSYLGTNMTDEELAGIDPDQLFIYQVIKNEDGFSKGIHRGYYGSYEDISELDILSDAFRSDSEWSYYYADRICYDEVKGIIYYRADGKYYPVQNVSLCYAGGSEGAMIYNYDYDFNVKGYKLNHKTEADGAEWVDGSAGEFAPVEVEPVDESTLPVVTEQERIGDTAQSVMTDGVQGILDGDGNGSIVNLARLNDTAFDCDNWGTILLDNIRSIRGDELMRIDSGDIADEFFIDGEGYYLDENYTLVVREDVLSEQYWIVSIVPDHVPENIIGSRYNQDSWAIDFYYDLADRNLFQGLGISIFVLVLSFGFLVYAAGHRRAVEGIVLTPIDRIPVEILSVVVGLVEFGLLFFGMVIIEDIGLYRSAYACIGTSSLFGGIMAVIAVVYLLSLCVRVKAGKWWRNSICYRVYSWIRDIVVNIFRNFNVFWKLAVVIGIVSVIELYCIVMFYNDDEFFALLWLIEKLIICAVLFLLAAQMHELQKASQCMAEGDLSYKINTGKMFWECKKHGENLNKISEGMSKAVDERMKSERLKTELITNVSHDIKTPLTSIINYVDLLSKEELHNDKAVSYLEVLDRQSSKLKKLIEDLVEASKASSGNLAVDSQQLEAGVFVTQTVGEYEEKLYDAGLELIVSKPEEPVYIMADGRHIWRVIDNLMNNICKYAQKGSRVYVNLETTERNVTITFRNISDYPLNINGEELLERFVRGDRSRNTEGHGLGLSIAQSLMKLINGDMNIVVDGDLFKVVLTFDRYMPEPEQEFDLEKTPADIDRNSRDLV